MESGPWIGTCQAGTGSTDDGASKSADASPTGGQGAAASVARATPGPNRRLEAALAQSKQDLKASQRELTVVKRRGELLDKEKDRVHAELLRALERADKLEALCRELQRQRETVGEESKRVLAEEQQKRQQLSRKFSSMVKDIQSKLDDKDRDRVEAQALIDKNVALTAEMNALRERVAALAEKDSLREQHVVAQVKAKELEAQLAEARLREAQELLSQEREQRTLAERRAELSDVELRRQMEVFSGKYDSFQESLVASTEGLTRLRQEMEKSSKRIRQLERDKDELRTRCSRISDQKAKLEALCRVMQDERRRERIMKDHSAAARALASGTREHDGGGLDTSAVAGPPCAVEAPEAADVPGAKGLSAGETARPSAPTAVAAEVSTSEDHSDGAGAGCGEAGDEPESSQDSDGSRSAVGALSVTLTQTRQPATGPG